MSKQKNVDLSLQRVEKLINDSILDLVEQSEYSKEEDIEKVEYFSITSRKIVHIF